MKKIDFNQDWVFTDQERNRREQVILPHDAMINTERDAGMRTYFCWPVFMAVPTNIQRNFLCQRKRKNRDGCWSLKPYTV